MLFLLAERVVHERQVRLPLTELHKMSADVPGNACILPCSRSSPMGHQQLCTLTTDLLLKQQLTRAKMQLLSQGCNSSA